MANPVVKIGIAAAKAVAKKNALAESKTGKIRKIKKSINSPKMQRKFENLTRGSNTTSPSSIAKFPNQTKPIPVKKKGK